MQIGIIGSGVVGQTVGAKLVALGHHVVLGTRDPSDLDGKKGYGGSLREWLDRAAAAGPGAGAARVGTFADAAEHGELVVNATSGAATLDALALAGAERLAGKVLLDIANPLDFRRGAPPTLFVKDTDSLGERVQRAHPAARVVKALNTMNAQVMVDPASVAGGDHTVFVSGNDAGAKARVAGLLRSFGWRDVLDLGDISTARGTEMLLPVWLRTWQALGSPMFQFKVAR